MKKCFHLLLLFLILLLHPAPDATGLDVASVPLSIEGSFQFRSSLAGGADLNATYQYDETWFLNSSIDYQHDLARMSLRLAMAAFGCTNTQDFADIHYLSEEYPHAASGNIATLLRELRFQNIHIDYPVPEENTIGYAIGSKNIRTVSGERFSLVCVAVRGGGYYSEWAGNFHLGTEQDHAGFSAASSRLLSGIQDYLTKYEADLDDNLKLWLTGYSRAGAVVNLCARSLDDGVLEKYVSAPENLFAFCFECPAVTTDKSRNDPCYDNLVSIVNPADLIPQLPISIWGYGRYGRTFVFPSIEQGALRFNALNAAMHTRYDALLADTPIGSAAGLLPSALFQRMLLDTGLSTVGAFLPSQQTYVERMEARAMEAGLQIFGTPENSNEESGSYGVTADAALLRSLLNALGIPEMLPSQLPLSAAVSDQLCRMIVLGHYAELCLAWMDTLGEI